MSVAALAALAADESRFAGADAELAASLRAALKQVHDEAVASGRRAASALGDAVRAVRPTPELLVDGVDRETFIDGAIRRCPLLFGVFFLSVSYKMERLFERDAAPRGGPSDSFGPDSGVLE